MPITVYEPMDVTIVEDHHESGRVTGSGPNPGYDKRRSRIDHLRWIAGCIKARTGGVTVRFNDGARVTGPGYDDKWPVLIGFTVGCQSFSELDYNAELALRYIETGAIAAQGWSAKCPS